MASAMWFTYENLDMYISYNVVFGVEANMETWTEVLECQNKADAVRVVNLLNGIGAGPYADTATVQSRWQTELRKGGRDTRQPITLSEKKSTIR